MRKRFHWRPMAWLFPLWVSACAYLTVNDVETGKSPAYPNLQPLTVNRPYDEVFQEAVAVISSLPRWRLVGASVELGEIRAEVETPLFRFVDDVTVQISGENPVVVNVRSRSRVGKGDLGKNAKNISLLLETLKQRLIRGSPL
jgi:uncharacterized protein (DUF1499 family)